MRKQLLVGAVAIALALTGTASAEEQAPATSAAVEIGELRLAPEVLGQLRVRWYEQLRQEYGDGSWAPARMELGDEELALMGLPPKDVLLAHDYDEPTVFVDGEARPLSSHAKGDDQDKGGKGGGSGDGSDEDALATFAGTGFFGIRPGAWLLLLDGGIGWCSLAHVYGESGSYKVSTAGHCGKVGHTATAIGVVGNNTPVLLDFGKFSKSTGDGGIGKDWALIDVFEQYQHLVTPTMAFWGGPLGVYTKTGRVADVTFPQRKAPTPKVNPDPFLAQQVVHYGHGTAIGTGGTPRTGTAIVWDDDHFSFFGALTPGDSGSGTNTLTGDSVGANRQAAGINTHIYVDPSLKWGLGVMAGTRTRLVGTPANGQLVPYPVPASGLP